MFWLFCFNQSWVTLSGMCFIYYQYFNQHFDENLVMKCLMKLIQTRKFKSLIMQKLAWVLLRSFTIGSTLIMSILLLWVRVIVTDHINYQQYPKFLILWLLVGWAQSMIYQFLIITHIKSEISWYEDLSTERFLV